MGTPQPAPSILSSLATQTRTVRRRKCLSSTIGKNNSGARAALGGGGLLPSCHLGLASENTFPAGNAPDTLLRANKILWYSSAPPARVLIVPETITEASLGLYPSHFLLEQPERWVLSAPFYRWDTEGQGGVTTCLQGTACQPPNPALDYCVLLTLALKLRPDFQAQLCS